MNSILGQRQNCGVKKKAIKDDFLPQLNILRDDLAGNDCEGGAESKDIANGEE